MTKAKGIGLKRLCGLLLVVGLIFPRVGLSQTTTNVDVNSQGERANGFSTNSVLSSDGRYVAFQSNASNLVAGDSNGARDIFVHDRQNETTTRVSVNTEGGDPNGTSDWPSLSADGRYVAFHSGANNLIEGGTFNPPEIFVYDRQTETTTRLNVGDRDGSLLFPHLSANGRWVAFWSNAPNLIAGDDNGVEDIFVYDRQTETTTRVSVNTEGGDPNGESFDPHLSGNGRLVTFQSAATNLVVGDDNGVEDIFVYDRQTATTTRVSVNTEGGDPDEISPNPSLSADGRFVTFQSAATNLVVGDDNGVEDIFVYDRQTETTTRVSVNTEGGDPNGESFDPHLSGNGRFVTFISRATNLVRGDTNERQDVFVHDLHTKTITRVNVNNQGEEANDYSQLPFISGDGRVVAFGAGATNLVANGKVERGPSIFVRDRANPDRADLDGDEISDLVWRNTSSGATAVWLMNPSGQRQQASFPGGASLDWEIRGASDVTGDGQADLVWHNMGSGETAVWLMNRDGLREASTFPGGAGLDWSIQGVGDVNNDGKADLVWRNTNSGATAVWLMDDSAQRKEATFPGDVGLEWTIRHVADVNRDGTADWVWRNTSTGATAVWLMNRSGLRESATFPGGVGLAWSIQGIGDVNGDGFGDLVWSNQETGATAVWLMNASGLRKGATFPGAVGLVWTIQDVGDVNGDGHADVVWRRTDNGATGVWLMNAEGLRQGVTFPGGAELDWELRP